MKKMMILPAFALSALLVGCGEKEKEAKNDTGTATEVKKADKSEDDHDHGEEVELGKFMVGEMEVEAAQSHGAVEASKEGHLVIKLPFNDGGATIVRAWIGTEDRTLSAVGKGEYAASHDDYDIHVMAPEPLPENPQWWVEVEKPDGTKAVGSIAPKM